MRILVVEDDRKIASFISNGLKQAGFSVDWADDGIEGFNLASTETYDALVVDVMLPRMNGIEMIGDLRKNGKGTPALILSAKDAVEDRVRGLQGGADDYLTKPFAFSELLARIHALLRRAHALAEPTSLAAADLAMDIVRRSVVRAGKTIELQPREFSLLEYLLRNKGRIVSKTMIMEHVWGYGFDPQTNVVESRISHLRDKIDAGFSRSLIRTVRGAGYVLEE